MPWLDIVNLDNKILTSSPSVRRKKMIECISNCFTNNANLSAGQKSALKGRADAIIDQAHFNIGYRTPVTTQQKWHNVQKEINTMILSAGPPISWEIEHPDPSVNAMFKMLMGGEYKKSDVITWRTFVAVCIKKDPGLLEKVRDHTKNVLRHIYGQIEAQQKELENLQGALLNLEAIISNILAFYAYFDPQEKEQISVPVCTKGQWEMVDYTVHRIPLTPRWLGSSMTAFGLTSIGEGHPPLLLFKGTTYATDDGFLLSLLSDINPFASPGSYALCMGKSKILNWCDKLPKVRVIGQSLGGTLSQLTASRLSSCVEKVYPINPTALLGYELWSWNKYRTNLTQQGKANEVPEVTPLFQDGDTVPLAGKVWGKGWNTVCVVGPKKKNPLLSHLQCNAAMKDCLMLKVNPERDAQKASRKRMSTAHMILSVPMFIVGCVFLTVYLIISRICALVAFLFTRKPKTAPLAPADAQV